MNKNSKTETASQKPVQTVLPSTSINGNLTAKPDRTNSSGDGSYDATVDSEVMEYGEMNLQDAKESGYTDEEGKAVDMAKQDVKGSPTGAYTDIGAGRSSAIHHENKNTQDRH
ncbi:MAG: hypothetical protein V4736_01115 [Bdellovibrionota bacterium]